ncbi:hypothetical protein BP00DRAFT_428348 [Aspergillus indologenus CBS 114.80]|uniref:Uncharacterized protein n=1 Tax=Aspergillus indologenus CBS 114.80 TaxID=1450541 RepID=A0A2V5I3C6_9EURO|nr:hypothetical protein BP00DRAFT_428348 [Aspergillus indologenus CBS 114.80]
MDCTSKKKQHIAPRNAIFVLVNCCEESKDQFYCCRMKTSYLPYLYLLYILVDMSFTRTPYACLVTNMRTSHWRVCITINSIDGATPTVISKAVLSRS